MSRCFPFPPPGYEKKTRTDDVDLLNKKTSDEKKFLEKPEGHSGEKFIQKEKGRDKDRSSFSSEKNFAGHISSFNREKIGQNSHPAQGFRDSKFVQELAGRVRDEGAGAASQLADKTMGTNRKRDEGMVGFVAKTAHKPAEEKEKSKRSDDRRFDVQGIKEETRAGGNAMVPNLAGAVKAKVEGIPKQVENNTEKRGEGKEKVKEKEGSNKDGPGGNINLKTSHPSKDGNKGVVAEENLRKRKDLEKNGFFHVDDIKPNKLPKTSSSQPLTGNGRTLEPCQAPIPLTLDSKGAGTSLKVDNKERKVNGIIEAQLLSVSPPKQLSSSAQASQIDEVSIRPPHPDLKYLSQVLSVPKMEQWSDFDDQSWLFHSIESQSKKPKVGFSEIDEPPQCCSECFQTTDCHIDLPRQPSRHSTAGSVGCISASWYQATNSFQSTQTDESNRMTEGCLKRRFESHEAVLVLKLTKPLFCLKHPVSSHNRLIFNPLPVSGFFMLILRTGENWKPDDPEKLR
ncbi:hypothetical protein GOBAR_DD03923 [Gossypium barbadense]|nr:hypothetical protein GOBAR_DD03923 [Gossypium barbadense]